MQETLDKGIVAIIDADMLRYSCGFAVEKYDKDTDIRTVEPVHHAYYNVNSLMKKILARCETQDYKAVLTKIGDKTNFRFGVFKYYKENRVKCAEECGSLHPYDCHEELGHELAGKRPVYYKEIHEYIKHKWKAEETEGQEADDQVCILQHQYNPTGFDEKVVKSVICSLDKDFNTVPGWHFNWKKDEFWFVSELQAKRNFYLQILTGDVADNIPRVTKGWRQKQAEERINKCNNEEELLTVVRDIVKLEHEKTGYIGDPDAFIIQNGKLCHLKTTGDDTWDLPQNLNP